MKAIIATIVVLAVAACNTSTPNRSAFQAAPSPVTYGNAPAYTPSAATPQSFADSRAPGWYKASSGVPWVVVQSRTLRETGRPESNYKAVQSAFGYSSSNWRPPHAMQLNTEHGNALARLVSVDGSTYLVLKRLRVKEVFKALFYSNKPYENLMEASIHRAGCLRTGNTIVRESGGNVAALAAPVSC